jgi:hypothetical protein
VFCGVVFRRVVRRYRGGGARGVLDATAMGEIFGPSSCRIPGPLGFLSSPVSFEFRGGGRNSGVSPLCSTVEI